MGVAANKSINLTPGGAGYPSVKCYKWRINTRISVMESKKEIIKANTINYRKGFIEVTPAIHYGCINIEAWNIHPDKDIRNISVGMNMLADEDVIGNVEIELNEDEVRALISMLERSLDKVN